jgi:hypothetical protein
VIGGIEVMQSNGKPFVIGMARGPTTRQSAIQSS